MPNSTLPVQNNSTAAPSTSSNLSVRADIGGTSKTIAPAPAILTVKQKEINNKTKLIAKVMPNNTLPVQNNFTAAPSTSANLSARADIGGTSKVIAPANLIVKQKEINNKQAERQNKNMSLYKGRVKQVSATDESKKILKGVRTNRRFELQMKFRQDIEDEQNT